MSFGAKPFSKMAVEAPSRPRNLGDSQPRYLLRSGQLPRPPLAPAALGSSSGASRLEHLLVAWHPRRWERPGPDLRRPLVRRPEVELQAVLLLGRRQELLGEEQGQSQPGWYLRTPVVSTRVGPQVRRTAAGGTAHWTDHLSICWTQQCLKTGPRARAVGAQSQSQ